MSPRPRTVADADILLAAGRVLSRVGPTRLTLAGVGRAARLSPGALIKRFGSKRGLLLAMSRESVESVDACFAQVRSTHPAPLDAFVAAALEMTRYVQTPQEVANHLAYFQLDLGDPDFYALMKQSHTRIEAGYRALLDEAAQAGELVPCDTARLARAVGALATGSLLGWAVARRGTAEVWVREDLGMLLNRYRQSPQRAPRMRSRRGRAHRIPRARGR
ncbi:MAG: TetR/AcrR family transcriptional regulator [Vicinamibacterales bacterium]